MKWSTNRRTKCGQSVMCTKTVYYALCFEELFYEKASWDLNFCGLSTVIHLKPCGKFLVGIQF